MVDFVAYNPAGRIEMVGQCPDAMIRLQGKTPGGAQLDCLEGTATFGEDWVDVSQTPPKVLPREPAPISLVGMALHSIPYPAQLMVDGPIQASVRVTQSGVVLSFDVPGAYRIEVAPEHPRWRLWEAEVVV